MANNVQAEAKQLLGNLDAGVLEYRLAYAICATKGYCAYCGVDLIQEWSPAYAVDHLLPKCQYRKHEDTPENWVLSCAICNDYKGMFDPLVGHENADHMLNHCRSVRRLIRKSAAHIREQRAASEQTWRSRTREFVRG